MEERLALCAKDRGLGSSAVCPPVTNGLFSKLGSLFKSPIQYGTFIKGPQFGELPKHFGLEFRVSLPSCFP